MSKYFVFNVPQYGHVNPTLAIVQELVARGHEVIYYLSGEFQQAIEATGATFREYTSVLDSSIEFVIEQPGRLSQNEVVSRLFDECLRVFPQVLEDVKQGKPDVILYTPIAIWGRFLSQILNVPAVSVRTSYVSNERFQLFSLDSGRRDQETIVQERALLTEFKEHIQRLGNQYAIPAFDLESIFLHVEALNLVCMPKVFQIAGNSFDRRYKFVGPCIAPRVDTTGFPKECLHKRQTLYISLGTIYNNRPDFYDMCFKAFKRSPWQVVMAVGDNVNQELFEFIPKKFVVHPHVPQLEVLEHTDVFITHGGMNSTMEALYYGVPLVVIPQIKEQAVTAKRVTELGLGISLDRNNLTPSMLHEAVAQVMSNPVYHINAQKMKQNIERAGGYMAAVEAITEFTKASRPAVSSY